MSAPLEPGISAETPLGPELLCLADVEPRAVNWLWEPFIPTGMLTMLSGDPGTGKSFIALSIAAELSRGRLRDGRIVEPANTLYLSVENPVAESLRPRFDALGGDPARFFLLEGKPQFDAHGNKHLTAVSLHRCQRVSRFRIPRRTATLARVRRDEEASGNLSTTPRGITVGMTVLHLPRVRPGQIGVSGE